MGRFAAYKLREEFCQGIAGGVLILFILGP
jgi:hypothetical protein